MEVNKATQTVTGYKYGEIHSMRIAIYKSIEASGNVALAHWFWENTLHTEAGERSYKIEG